MKYSSINTRFVNKIKKYLDNSNAPFVELGNTRNLIVLKASGNYHYMLIHFYDMPEKAMDNFRYFDVKTTYAITYEQVMSSIKSYLNEE